MSILEWFAKWEPIWLFLILAVETGIGFLTLLWVRREYFYDKEKDDLRKQRKTRTTRKTTRNAGGESITEESSEVIEPIPDREVPK